MQQESICRHQPPALCSAGAEVGVLHQICVVTHDVKMRTESLGSAGRVIARPRLRLVQALHKAFDAEEPRVCRAPPTVLTERQQRLMLFR